MPLEVYFVRHQLHMHTHLSYRGEKGITREEHTPCLGHTASPSVCVCAGIVCLVCMCVSDGGASFFFGVCVCVKGVSV